MIRKTQENLRYAFTHLPPRMGILAAIILAGMFISCVRSVDWYPERSIPTAGSQLHLIKYQELKGQNRA